MMQWLACSIEERSRHTYIEGPSYWNLRIIVMSLSWTASMARTKYGLAGMNTSVMANHGTRTAS